MVYEAALQNKLQITYFLFECLFLEVKKVATSKGQQIVPMFPSVS
jgi:hypothetical protein